MEDGSVSNLSEIEDIRNLEKYATGKVDQGLQQEQSFQIKRGSETGLLVEKPIQEKQDQTLEEEIEQFALNHARLMKQDAGPERLAQEKVLVENLSEEARFELAFSGDYACLEESYFTTQENHANAGPEGAGSNPVPLAPA